MAWRSVPARENDSVRPPGRRQHDGVSATGRAGTGRPLPVHWGAGAGMPSMEEPPPMRARLARRAPHSARPGACDGVSESDGSWGRHVHLMIALQEKADPQGAILPGAAHLQDQGDHVGRSRVRVILGGPIAIPQGREPALSVPAAPPVEDRAGDPKEPAGLAGISGDVLPMVEHAQSRPGSALLFALFGRLSHDRPPGAGLRDTALPVHQEPY